MGTRLQGAVRLVPALLLLAACAEPRLDPRATLYVEPETPSGITQATLDAAEEWSKATHDRVRLRIWIGTPSGSEARVRVHDTPHVSAVADAELSNPITINVETNLVSVADDALSRPLVRAVLDHELGHGFMGPEHHDSGLMQPSGGYCIDRATLARFCTTWGCPNGSESTCPSGPRGSSLRP